MAIRLYNKHITLYVWKIKSDIYEEILLQQAESRKPPKGDIQIWYKCLHIQKGRKPRV